MPIGPQRSEVNFHWFRFPVTVPLLAMRTAQAEFYHVPVPAHLGLGKFPSENEDIDPQQQNGQGDYHSGDENKL